MKVGDIITKDEDTIFKSMNAGSVIKIISGSYRGTSNSYVMRLSEKAESTSNRGGVCIMSPVYDEIGQLWGTSLDTYHYEIIKLT